MAKLMGYNFEEYEINISEAPCLHIFIIQYLFVRRVQNDKQLILGILCFNHMKQHLFGIKGSADCRVAVAWNVCHIYIS